MESKQEDLKKGQKDYNSRLIMRNNQEDADDGIKKILVALEWDPNLSKAKNLTFQNNIPKSHSTDMSKMV